MSPQPLDSVLPQVSHAGLAGGGQQLSGGGAKVGLVEGLRLCYLCLHEG